MKFILLFLIFITLVLGQEAKTIEELELLSLEELLNMKVSTASNKAKSVREQPGIVSIIREDEILNSGARNLTDVLRLVSGFSFAGDVFTHGSWIFRGIWSIEGKVLLLVDGREYNDPSWGNVPLFNSFPVDNIKQIEVIRGPGSAKFGNYAELAIVKITTKGYKDDQLFVSNQFGSMSDLKIGRTNTIINFGEVIAMGGYSVGLHNMQGNLSDQTYRDFNGLEWDMKNNSNTISQGINIGATLNEFDFRFISDRTFREMETIFGPIDSAKSAISSSSVFASMQYKWEINNKLTLIPYISHLYQSPYEVEVVDDFANEPRDEYTPGLFYNLKTKRSIYRLSGTYDFSNKLNVHLGTDYTQIFGEIAQAGGIWGGEVSTYFMGASNEVSYNDFSVYMQAEYYSDFGNFIFGSRYANHNGISGSSFVPRFAYTKVMDKLHLKLLYSQSYRVGDIEHINLAERKLKPEKTNVSEIEIGYQISESIFASANIFSIKIDDPIVYTGDNTTTNKGLLGSEGIEIEAKIVDTFGYTSINYSFYKTKNASIDNYVPSSNQDVYIAAPSSKFSLHSSFNISDKIAFSPSLIYLGERYDVSSFGEQVLDSKTFVNLMFNYTLSNETAISFGVNDLLNEKYNFIQAYYGDYAPLPGPSREFLLKLIYKL